ncbi:MAG: hypothetical protein ACRBN8_32525 [Nannocystales bacterium]
MRRDARFCTALVFGLLSACGGEATSSGSFAETDEPETPQDEMGSSGGDETGVETLGTDETGEPPSSSVGRCDYTNPFSMGPECREYIGSDWTGEDVEADCVDRGGDAALDVTCDSSGILGRCTVDGGTEREVQIVSYGADAGSCAITRTGCETFGGGAFEPGDVCAGDDPGDTGGGAGPGSPFIQPTLECRDAIAGEAPGDGPDGQICTWQLISGATEEGRRFADYADCNVVYTQRPYYAVAGNDETQDERMEDPVYAAEVDWVREQVEATACACCHSDVAPMGTSNWTIDAPGNWVGTFDDTGLAFSAGWIDSTSFGEFAPEDNNGFDRTYGIPSTEPLRMRDFFLAELEHRGLVEEDFADEPAFGGPLSTQLEYEPTACEKGERVDRDGSIHWDGGGARYVYVLESGSASPTVPPNLDLPDGTLWRLDVPWDEDEVLFSGDVEYGAGPSFAVQDYPVADSAPTLVPGQEYYLYVSADVGIPLTRCLFTY